MTRAGAGDVIAARDVVAAAARALRGLLTNRELPDPDELVYLSSLSASLASIEQGADPSEALHLVNPGHRVADPNIGVRDALLFVLVGQALDQLTDGLGQTRKDKPTTTAIRKVANGTGLSRDTVQKAWSIQGACKSWAIRKADWK